MAALDPRIEIVRKEYGLSASDFWELPQKKGTWIIKHSALEVVAAKAEISFDMPMVLEANGQEGTAAVCVRGTWKNRAIWSIGEASPKNCKNAYPWAIAEKRAVDRVILKLIGLHGLAYSEDEADDFKQLHTPAPPQQEQPKATKPPPYDDPDGQMQNWIDLQKTFLSNCENLAEVQHWEESRADAMKRLHSKNLKAWGDLTAFKESRIRELQPKKGKAA